MRIYCLLLGEIRRVDFLFGCGSCICMRIFNYGYVKERRRLLRKLETPTEKRLWEYLRCKRLYGIKFFRQYSIGWRIVDFYCPMSRLIVELDGGYHFEVNQQILDRERTLMRKSFRVLKMS